METYISILTNTCISCFSSYKTACMHYAQVALVNGHYSIGYSINNYASENNSLLYDGACCEVNTSTGSGCQEGGCRTTLRLCFRDANHSHTDSDSSCFNAINRRNVNFFFQTPLDVHIISNYFVVRI